MSRSRPLSAPPAAQPETTSIAERRAARADEIVFFALTLAGIICWFRLYRWYSLLDNRTRNHFAFEKIPGQFDSPILRRTLLLFLAIAVVYAVGYGIIRRAPRISRALKVGIAASILGPGIVNVILYPVGALDVFNYLIELKLTYHYDANPYLETFKAFRQDSFAKPAFLTDTPLFYGPVWLIVSRLPGMVTGYADVVDLLLAMKVLNAGLLVLTATAIFRYHGADDRRRWLAVYAFLANPLVLFEGLANAHNDVMMTFFLVVALVSLRERSGLSAALLAASALVKFFTAALAPLFVLVMALRKWGFRRVALAAGLTTALVVVTVAPFWAGGRMIDGLREGTKASQEMNHVSIFSLAQQYEREQEIARLAKQTRGVYAKRMFQAQQLSPDAKDRLQRIFLGIFAIAALIVLVGVARGRPPEAAAVDTLILFSLLLTNLYPWYLIPIFAVLALRSDRLGTAYLLVGTALGLAYYPFYVWAHFNSGWQEKFHVHLFLALFLTVPMVVYLLAETGRWGIVTTVRRRATTSAVASVRRPAPRRSRVGAS